MAVGGCNKCMKYTLVAFNFLVLCTGGVVLGLGIYVLVTDYGVDKLEPILGNEVFKAGTYLLIILGSITIVISFMGCAGAAFEIRCLLAFYFIIMLLLTLFFIVVTILGFVFKDRLSDEVKTDLQNSIINKYGLNVTEEVTGLWDSIQKEFECCGVNGDVTSNTTWALYQKSEWYKAQNIIPKKFVPDSCCKPNTTIMCNVRVGPPYSPDMDLYQKGCYDELVGFIDKYGAIIGGIAVAALCVMLVGTIFAICLCVAIGRDKNYTV